MTTSSPIQSALRLLAVGAGVAAGAYAAYAGMSWYRYGRHGESDADERDRLLDRFMPTYEVFERHRIRVDAPAEVTLAAAREQDLFGSPLIRLIFEARAIVLGATPDDEARPVTLLEFMQSIGWGILAEEMGREVVVGAVTRPWEADVVFRALPPDEFAAFHEPGYVKIAWTLRADPVADGASIFRTETRAVATDPAARSRFRGYWALASPGIAVIRELTLRPVKLEAERRVRVSTTHRGTEALRTSLSPK